MENKRRQVLIASNVHHTDTAAVAAGEIGLDVRAFGPAPWPAGAWRRVAEMKTQSAFISRLAQHAAHERSNLLSVGPGQYVPHALGTLKLPYKGAVVRWTHLLQAGYVAAATREKPIILHAVEGLLEPLLTRWRGTPSIMERRNQHYRVFEQFRPPLPGFPVSQPFRDPMGRILDREFSKADRVVVYSEVSAKSLVAHGVSESKIRVIPIAYEPSPEATLGERDQRSIERSKDTAIFVGRATVIKGIDIAVEAVRRSQAFNRLIVVGAATPPIQAWLESLPWVTYVGIQPRTEVKSLMRTAGLFLMPSEESYGIAVLEAVDMDCPVLLSSHTGVASLLKKQGSGFAVNSFDLDDWVACLDEFALLSDLEVQRRTAAQRDIFLEISQRKVVNAYADLYGEILNS